MRTAPPSGLGYRTVVFLRPQADSGFGVTQPLLHVRTFLHPVSTCSLELRSGAFLLINGSISPEYGLRWLPAGKHGINAFLPRFL
jgi:hypothetical protein